MYRGIRAAGTSVIMISYATPLHSGRLALVILDAASSVWLSSLYLESHPSLL